MFGDFFFPLLNLALFKCLRQSSKVSVIFENPLEILAAILLYFISENFHFDN